MSETSAFGFGKFVPGFEFLQNLSQTATKASPVAGGMAGMSNWVAPTLSVEELDKRIQELKTVQFWLEQNGTALKATIQALEVQKMTLTTLQGMNVNMTELAKAFTARTPVATTPNPTATATPEPEPAANSEVQDEQKAKPVSKPAAGSKTSARPKSGKPAPVAVDPMQWWGSLTQQFQNIAAAAMQDAAAHAAQDRKAPASDSASTASPRKPSARSATRQATGKKATVTPKQRSPRP